MGYKVRKNLFLIAAIILVCAFFTKVFDLVELLISPTEVLESYVEIFESIQIEGDFAIELEYLQNILFGILLTADIIGIISSVVFAVLYFVIYRFDEQKFAQKKTFLIVVSVLQFVFVTKFSVAVLSFVAIFAKNNQNSTVPQTSVYEKLDSSADSINDSQAIVQQINKLKDLKKCGAITDEEYEQLLSDIIK